jgi:predicted nucleic acid-binding protein
MSDRHFIDTNVLVYAYDTHCREKQERAKAVLEDALAMENGMVSTQVLSEFYVVVTSRGKSPLSSEEAEDILRKCAEIHVVTTDRALVMRAIETQRRYVMSYWDALIVSAAERGGCSRILTEDLNEGQTYHGILVVNPFSAATPAPRTPRAEG